MKKQFFRVKQLADQTFSRADKTKVLSDDLQDADHKVEYIRAACHKTSKNLSSGLVTQGQDPAAKEKRLKKYPEYMLSLAMQECSCSKDDFLLRSILEKCSKVEMALASESFEHELSVEQRVVTPLNDIIDREFPNILKHKRNLQKLILDMDSARTRHVTATKQVGGARAVTIKDELEEAELKVEQCRDALASEMFMLISKEAQLAQSVVLHVKLQKEYHQSALQVLDEIIPELEADINDSSSKPVYRYPLEEHLRVTQRKIAFPIELCVCALLEIGMEEEGLFRIAAGTSKLRRMKLSLDACCLTLPTALDYGDPHVVAGALKSYLRELPEPLMTHALYVEWMSVAKIAEKEPRLNAMRGVLRKLPEANHDNLRYLIKFLAKLTESKEKNKMSPQNIAIVIAPNLIWSPTEENTNIGMNMNMANMYSSIVDTLISHSDWFFKGEETFYLTIQPEPQQQETSHINGMTRSVGQVTITHQDDLDYYGHTRSSSNDTNLINLADENALKRTQSNSSLSDSPPHGGSPKPATRRKNKPAPVPPGNKDAQDKPPRPVGPPAVSTLPRPAKKPMAAEETRTVASADIVESSRLIHAEKQTRGTNTDHLERNTLLRRSADSQDKSKGSYEHVKISANSQERSKGNYESIKISANSQDKSKGNYESVKVSANSQDKSKGSYENVKVSAKKEGDNFKVPEHEFARPKELEDNNQNTKVFGMKSQEEHNLEKSEGNHPSSTILIPTTVNSPSSKVTVNCEQKSQPFQISNSSTLDRKRVQKPVAAPRSTVGPGDNAEVKEETENVTMRRVSIEAADRSNKPAIPERPSALQRPTSFGNKTPRNSAELDALPDAERPSLERIHMYCVDKQQVSIIQVGGEREKEKTGIPSTVPNDHAESDASTPTQDARVDKPERPPKPDHIATKPASPSHTRALSEGNLLDALEVKVCQTGTSSRPPRPQPPPPPPPVKPRAESVGGESTDL